MTALREWLATLDQPTLERVLTERRDAVWGAPVTGLDDLAERLVHPGSTAMAVQRLPAPHLQVLELVLALGRGATPDRVAELLDPAPGPRPHEDAVGEALDALAAPALVWREPDGRLEVNPALPDLVGEPLGLGRSAASSAPPVPAQGLQPVARAWGLTSPTRKADLVDAVVGVFAHPQRLRARVGEAPEEVATWLVRHARSRFERARTVAEPAADGDLPPHLRDPNEYAVFRRVLAWATKAGVALPDLTSWNAGHIPSEVMLALVDAGARLPFAPEPPALPTAPVSPERVGASAAAAVTEQLGVTMAVVEHAARRPLAVLKSTGGIGTRAVAQLAKAVGADVAPVRLGLECAGHLGLLAVTDRGLGADDDVFGAWRSDPPADRAAELLRVWRGLPLAATLERDEDGSARPVLGGLGDGRAIHARMCAITLLHELADDVGLTSTEALADAVAWRYPLLLGRGVRRDVEQALLEAELLGVVSQGALTPVGRSLAAETLPGVEALPLERTLAAMLPEVQSRAIIGSDLTILVPGSPAPALVDLLDTVAVREARGAASTWRVTPESVRGALDCGYAADDVLESLERAAGGELPQPLTYLVRDVERRHGHLTVRPAGCVVVGQDAALVAEVEAQRGLRRLGLRRVAPTVLVASASDDDVLAGLRAAGYLPVAVDAGGVSTVELRRLPGADGGPGSVPGGGVDESWAASADDVAALWAGSEPIPDVVDRPVDDVPGAETPSDLAARLLSGASGAAADADVERTATEVRRMNRRLSTAEARQLAFAVAHRRPVQIAYRSRSGGETLRMVGDLRLLDRSLYGWCYLREAERWFDVSRILEVSAAPEPQGA